MKILFWLSMSSTTKHSQSTANKNKDFTSKFVESSFYTS